MERFKNHIEILISRGKEDKKIKMEEAKEVQQTIVPINQEKASEEEFFNVLKMISPGTNLRTALDGVLKSKRGALIVVENETLFPLMDGGFRVNCKFTPQRLVELSKMDGAIILGRDMKKINYSNVLLTPDNTIKSLETGARHKAAERTARQTGSLVIAISERRGEITLFYKNMKHIVKDANELLRKANEHIQLLEKQKELFEHYIEKLNKIEFRNAPSSNQAVNVIQRGRFIQKIAKEIKRYMIELGNEGTILKTRFKELTLGVEKETNLVIKDYTKLNLKKSKILLDSLSYDEIFDKENIFKVLGYAEQKKVNAIKGWRILSKTSLHEDEIAKLIKEIGNFEEIINVDSIQHKKIFPEEKLKIFKEELEKVRISLE